ncbi:MAG: hypothetical protein QM493_08650, partial [Sulfurovum sp.]
MYKLLLILLLIITTFLYAKVEIVRSYYESGELFSEQRYVDGTLDGTVTIFYKNGQIKRQSDSKDGQYSNEYKEFYENGDIRTILDTKESYYYPQGEDFALVTGRGKDSHSFRVEFKDKSKKDDHIKYKTDEFSMDFNLKDGQIDGPFIMNFDKATTEILNFKKGKIDGVAKRYIDGKLSGEAEFKNNKLESVTKEYYANGTLKTKVYYKNNKPHKEAISYSEDGLITSKIVIGENNQTTKYLYSENGDLVSRYSVDIDSARIPTYNNRNYMLNSNKPQPNQTYKLYYSDGSLREEVNITTSKGEARGYYRDEKLRYIIPYIKQYASGEAQYFDKKSSSPQELPLQALTEPCLIVSHHTALIAKIIDI